MGYRVLVTGGAGYLGSVLVRELLGAGHEVTVIDNFMFGPNSLMDCCAFDSFEVVRGDARDKGLMERLIKDKDYVIPLLKKTPTSKRAVVILLTPQKDILPLRREMPGLVMVNFNIRDGKLHTTLVLRSNDMFHGWPCNILQAYYLAEYVAKELNYPVGTLTTISVSAHIFGEQLQDILKVVGK